MQSTSMMTAMAIWATSIASIGLMVVAAATYDPEPESGAKNAVVEQIDRSAFTVAPRAVVAATIRAI